MLTRASTARSADDELLMLLTDAISHSEDFARERVLAAFLAFEARS